MESTAKARFLQLPPRKVRFVAELVRGKSVTEAYQILSFVKRRPALPVKKTIESAVANMMNEESSGQVAVDHLRVKSICVDGGPMTKRFRAGSMGRAFLVRKRSCHLTVVVEEVFE